MRKKRRKMKICLNMFFNIIALISVVIMLVFCGYIYKLGMIPFKYLSIIYAIIMIFYVIFLFFTLPRKIKTSIKTVCCVFMVIFSVLFVLGIKYVDKTISFIDKINDELSQKEDYHVMVLKSSLLKEIGNIRDKKVGLYQTSKNNTKAIDILKKEVPFEEVLYDDVVLMFEDLLEGKIDAVLINSSINNLIDSDLDYLKLDLLELDSISVPIEEVDIVKVVDVTNTPFNIYIAGGDAYGSISKVTNTDVNMVVTVDPVNKKLLLTSIPRDYYVNLPGQGENAYDKLTHAGYYGISESVSAVEKLLDIDINYYVKVNFSTIEGVIDAIGGVVIYVDKGFTTSNGMYTFKVGDCYMDGKKALRFARERKVFKDGDVQRVKNQQKVLSAIIDKMTSSTTLITNYADILESVKKNFSTNIDTKSINRLVKMQINDMTSWKIEKQNLVGSGASEKTYTFPNMKLYVMKRNENSVITASEKIKEFLK